MDGDGNETYMKRTRHHSNGWLTHVLAYIVHIKGDTHSRYWSTVSYSLCYRCLNWQSELIIWTKFEYNGYSLGILPREMVLKPFILRSEIVNYIGKKFSSCYHTLFIGGSKGGARDLRPPLPFIVMQFSKKILAKQALRVPEPLVNQVQQKQIMT